MSLRDWFASVALAGLCANPKYEHEGRDEKNLAEWAYLQAEAMLLERRGELAPVS
jgi:hypothetical protein